MIGIMLNVVECKTMNSGVHRRQNENGVCQRLVNSAAGKLERCTLGNLGTRNCLINHDLSSLRL